MNDTTIYLHLGAHKTASTMLQLAMQANESCLADHKLTCLSVHSTAFELYKPLRAALLQIVRGIVFNHYQHGDQGVIASRVRDAREKFLALAKSLDTSALLISDENLLGPPPGVQFRRPDVFISGLYAGIEPIVSALASVFDGFTTRVRFYTRRQSTLIESLYSNSVGNLTYGDDIENFLQSLNLAQFRFDEVVAALRHLSQDLSIQPYEMIEVLGADGYTAEFMQWLGIESADVALGTGPVINQGLNQVQVEVARTLWHHHGHLPPREKLCFIHWLREMPVGRVASSSRAGLTDLAKAELDAKFTNDLSYRLADARIKQAI